MKESILLKNKKPKTDLKSLTICVYDYGLFFSVAQKLSEEFGKVYYYTPWKNAFPTSNDLLPGEGYDNVERINDFWDYVEDIDLFIFPDIYDGDLQLYLQGIGKRVWGSRKGEETEILRWEFKQHMKKIGLPVQHTERIIGIKALRDHLKKVENKFIKISITRGDAESFHHMDYEISEAVIDEMEWRLGAKGHIMEFIIEDAIDARAEVGYDGWVIDGRFPNKVMFGIEKKGQSYFGEIREYDSLPKEVKFVNSKLSETLKEYGYRGNFSTEIRIAKDGTPYFIDSCARAGSPPTEVFIELITNLGEVMWHGSNGDVIEAEYAAKYGGEIILYSSFAKNNWQTVHYPKSIEQWVKLRNVTMIEGKQYIIPQRSGSVNLGAVIAIGNNIPEVVDTVKKRVDMIKGFKVEADKDSIDEAVEDIKKFPKTKE